MKKKEIEIENIESEIDDDYSNDDLYNINSWGADLSFRELITMYEEGELAKPELQRKYVWTKMEASRFIDSLLLGLPVPSIFLAISDKETKLIVDGYQRIMTVYDFVRGIFTEDNKIFKLSNSKKINERWKGKAFKELSETEQRKIKSTTIHAIIFEQIEPKSDDTSLYQIFERINTSGRTLMPQEIRNCVYQGKFNTMLIELNKTSSWRQLYNLESEDTRMRDIEFILRYFALELNNLKTITTQQISLKQFLNEFMGNKDAQNNEILEKRKSNFVNSMNFIIENIGKEAFHNISSEDPNKVINRFHPTIFDSIAIATNIALNISGLEINTSELKAKRIELLQNTDYINYISNRTTNIDHIKGRINLALEKLFGVTNA